VAAGPPIPMWGEHPVLDLFSIITFPFNFGMLCHRIKKSGEQGRGDGQMAGFHCRRLGPMRARRFPGRRDRPGDGPGLRWSRE
jgi:hypothetical protein